MSSSFAKARSDILAKADTKAEITEINKDIDTLTSGDNYKGLDAGEVEKIDELVNALKTLTDNTVVNDDFIKQIEKKLKDLKSKIADLTIKIKELEREKSSSTSTPTTTTTSSSTSTPTTTTTSSSTSTPASTPVAPGDTEEMKKLKKKLEYYKNILKNIITIINNNNNISSADSDKLFKIIHEIDATLMLTNLTNTVGGSPYIEYTGGNVGILGGVIGGALGTEFINFLNKYGEIIKLIIGCILLLFILVLIERYHTKKRCMSRRNILYINSHMM
jgi:hypothetical protein